jgi:excisionase family DNA binding protein
MRTQPVAVTNTTPTKYRLSDDKAAAILTSAPVNMTLMEAAVYARCSPRKLRDLVHSRRIKSARIGSKIIVRKEWIDAFLNAA